MFGRGCYRKDVCVLDLGEGCVGVFRLRVFLECI